MKIALIQFNGLWESIGPNLERAGAFIKQASEEGCAAAVLPEMFATGFSMNVPVVAEEGYGATAAALSAYAKTHRINLIAGLAMRVPKAEQARNMAVVYNREGLPAATYAKLHPFSYAGEDKHFIPGSGTVLFEVDGMPASVFICYDLRFPEAFRAVAWHVQAIFVIANWPASRREHWETLLKARAIENQCFIIGVNRTGTDGNGIRYPGASHVFDPLGNDLCAGNETDEYLTVEFDPGMVEKVRTEFPFLNDMKPFSFMTKEKRG